ncbi:MAG: hypothetical protein HC765_01645 [Brachymonas sp.]|nr:hypothetical protein [Brachymonas sp.]
MAILVAQVWFAYTGDDGKDLSSLIKGDRASGVIVLRLGAIVETRVKISIIGPKERSDATYPFFILPLKPGLHTYGLELADFKQPPWAKMPPRLNKRFKKSSVYQSNMPVETQTGWLKKVKFA